MFEYSGVSSRTGLSSIFNRSRFHFIDENQLFFTRYSNKNEKFQNGTLQKEIKSVVLEKQELENRYALN